MEGKRPNDKPGSDGIKRLKPTRDYEVSLDHGVYVDVDKLFGDPTLAPYFNKTYNRSVANFIKSAALDVANVARRTLPMGSLNPSHGTVPSWTFAWSRKTPRSTPSLRRLGGVPIRSRQW
jgi:hypothetical protein